MKNTFCRLNRKLRERYPTGHQAIALGEEIAIKVGKGRALPPYTRVIEIAGMMQVGKTLVAKAAINKLTAMAGAKKPLLMYFISQNQNVNKRQAEADLEGHRRVQSDRGIEPRETCEDYLVTIPSALSQFLNGKLRGKGSGKTFREWQAKMQQGHQLILIFDEDHHGLHRDGQLSRFFRALGISLRADQVLIPNNVVILALGATGWPARLLGVERVVVPEPEGYLSPEKLLESRGFHVQEEVVDSDGKVTGSFRRFLAKCCINHHALNLVVQASGDKHLKGAKAIGRAYRAHYRALGLKPTAIEVISYGSTEGCDRAVEDFEGDMAYPPKVPTLRLLINSYGCGMVFDSAMSRHICGKWVGCGAKPGQDWSKVQLDVLVQRLGRDCGHSKQHLTYPVACHVPLLKAAIAGMRAGLVFKGTYTKGKQRDRSVREPVMVSRDIARGQYVYPDGRLGSHCRFPGRHSGKGSRDREVFRLILIGGSLGSKHGREFVYVEEPTPGHEDTWSRFRSLYPQFFEANGGTSYIEMVPKGKAPGIVYDHTRSSMLRDDSSIVH